MSSAIEERIKKYIENDLSVQKIRITNNELLFSAGIIDSLGQIKLICFLEKEFRILINADELILENFNSVKKITDFVERKVAFK